MTIRYRSEVREGNGIGVIAHSCNYIVVTLARTRQKGDNPLFNRGTRQGERALVNMGNSRFVQWLHPIGINHILSPPLPTHPQQI